MHRRILAKTSKSQRDKATGKIYRLCQKLEKQINDEYEAEKTNVSIKIESDLENEQEIVVSTTTSDALLTSLMMTCSDSEDSFGASADFGPVLQTLNMFGLQNESSGKELTPAAVMDMFRMVMEHVKKVQTTSDCMRKEMEQITDRLGRVEKKVDILLAAFEQVKDGMAMNDRVPENGDGNSSNYFKMISNEEEFLEFDSKLGNDEEYYAKIKKWLTQKIYENDPNNRMLAAMDLIIEPKFFAQCNWTGASFDSAPKTAFRERTNVLKLFRVIGSNQSEVLNDSTVEKFFRQRLKNAKRRLTNKGLRKPACRKRKRTGEPSKR